ncbi:Oxygen sensor histidine kinase NreB [Listeria fleischmannii 1991]|uniref:Sensor histidine kinase n=3 Tax=Listeria fleischmannii TaxID=1069827 RepID=A0A2X3JGR1_9LIST|nr:ATP-binding protein [Listeria fleischmannii]KMT59689.1 Oxygen sensor histidine kinase NreB [Listeria fleischmannii 1991]SQC72339.1 Oxygen sensor histidine kinase nreB [Listeria fleischmannii subsp. fleischmannii]
MSSFTENSSLIQLFFEKTSDAVFIMDYEQRIINQNKAAQKLLHDALTDWKQISSFCYVCKGCTSSMEEHTCRDCRIKKREDGSSFQIYIELKNGLEIPYSASFSVIDEKSERCVLILRNLTEQQEIAKQLQKSTLTKYVLNAHENERKKLSRELHDGIAQEMYSALMEVRKLKYMEKGGTFDKQMDDVETSVTNLLTEIRNMAVDLRPAALDDLGLYSALKSYCKRYEQIFGVEVALISDVQNERFSSTVETTLYRVAQEAMLNAAKYADIDDIVVTLRKREKLLILEVIDDGVGFTLADMEIKGSGLGLLNMQERVELCGGICDIQSEHGKGTEVIVKIGVDSI